LYQLRQQFGEVPESLEETVLASQITQAEAYKFFIEMTRVARPRRSGIIWWNLLDGWPQTSDAVVDYYFRKKRAYDYIARVQKPFIIAIDEINEGRYSIVACNDTLEVISGKVLVMDAETEEVLFEKEFIANENTSTVLGDTNAVEFHHKKMLIIKWTANGENGFNHYLTGYPPYSLEWYRKLMDKYEL
jgi:beta-mannosidase